MAAVAVLLAAALANTCGTNITISGQNYAGSDSHAKRADQKTETNPNTITDQVWDTTGMFLPGSPLTLAGRFDFKNGAHHGGYNYKTGDISFDVDGDAQYGPPHAGSGATVWGDDPYTALADNTFGDDYMIDPDLAAGTSDVPGLSGLSQLVRVLDVATSNPWFYPGGGTASQGYQNQPLTDLSGLGNADTGFGGDDTNSTGSSNDNLMGQPGLTTAEHNNVPDSASTILLFGLTLLGFAGVRRKFGR